MQYFKPYTTLVVGIVIGMVVVPRLKGLIVK